MNRFAESSLIFDFLDMDFSSDYDSLRESNCTSCSVTQDKSSYWTPALYFIHANGTVEIAQEAGGMLA